MRHRESIIIDHDTQNINWLIALHLTAYLTFIFPFGNFIGAFVIWLMKRDEDESVNRHGKMAINFQISCFFYLVCFAITGVILTLLIVTIPFALVAFFSGFIISIIWMVAPAVAAHRASKGQLYQYPISIEFLR